MSSIVPSARRKISPRRRKQAWIGAAYILYLAWHMLRSAGTAPEEDRRQPGFRTGLLVNLTNVKVILFCFTALSSFVLPYTRSLWWLLGAGLFLELTGPACNLVWLFAGAQLKDLFAKHQKTVDRKSARTVSGSDPRFRNRILSVRRRGRAALDGTVAH